MLGESVGFPAASRLARQRHLAAMPPSMQASEDPMAEQPTGSAVSGAFHRSASMRTQRRSSSAVWGYSSLSMRFLSMQRSINLWTSGSSQVWQNVARFWRALPSRRSSSEIACMTSDGPHLVVGTVRRRQRCLQALVGVDRVEQLIPDGSPACAKA